MTSKNIKRAIELIASAKGKELSMEEREKMAIELASYLLKETAGLETFKEKNRQAELARMMEDPKGKAFTTKLTDECFRSKSANRIVSHLRHLIQTLGFPCYLGWTKRVGLFFFFLLSPFLTKLCAFLFAFLLRKETSSVILPGEAKALSKHMAKRRLEGVRLNLNHLGEAILGEKEALRRLHVYLEDLANPDVEYISIKISTIFSQIHLLAWENTMSILSDRLKQLYKAATSHVFIKPNGEKSAKFVNLDMEEYRDLHLTKELFISVLSEEEFLSTSAGIVLQSYLPDCLAIQQELTAWAKKRQERGGAPIKIRIVKGANLAMEQVEASARGWAQAPYTSKSLVDANYKKMVLFGCKKENARVVHLGIASHNLFDICFALLARAENGVEDTVTFEMLEGMADPLRRAMQMLSKDLLLYCPVATKQDFQSAIAYLIRRLDENTGPENFLRYIFRLKSGSPEWNNQALRFSSACEALDSHPTSPRRVQNRLDAPILYPIQEPFANEADTDFSLEINRKWARKIVSDWKNRTISCIPCVIAGKEEQFSLKGEGFDPSFPGKVFYSYSLAGEKEVDRAIQTAKEEEALWQAVSLEERAKLLARIAQKMREKRGDLIGVMIGDGAKTILEADPEVSEAIDFAEYYLRSMLQTKNYPDIDWKAKGTLLITPPWNFPVSIPAGGILAALATGNCVLFKPAPEAVLSGWVLANIFWEAGVSKKVLQFFSCTDDPVGSKLIANPRINGIILTGATATARLFMKLRPSLQLSAETGGKNALIVTALSDRDLAIKDLVNSAFGHSGQKCSAASLAILESEVYKDKHFLAQLKDAVESLSVGSAWDLQSKVTPLIRAPEGALLQALSTLEAGESWLVTPKQDPKNPNLWSPGVKLGVQANSFSHKTEFFGPVLCIMEAKNLEHAIELANQTPYGLTSGLSSLDEKEHTVWLEKIIAGNLYMNRGITGAIVRRQPFGGCKASSFGPGLKAGGPNYLFQFMHQKQLFLPENKQKLSPEVNRLTDFLDKISLSTEEMGLWFGSIASYAYFAGRLPRSYDPNNQDCLSDYVVGQDNSLYYTPRLQMALRITEKDAPLDILRVIAAVLSCNAPLEISWSSSPIAFHVHWQESFPSLVFTQESEEAFIQKISAQSFERVRLLSPASPELERAAAEAGCFLDLAPVLANGRFELLHYLREVALSYDYHRYGNLGLRENEKRNPIL
jgi:RHH-type transcriptional regulator, proline utilization regulon repressor / proline dehydrogenase / delta 1-pyrroline-5-carboxylate dehydrogenase